MKILFLLESYTENEAGRAILRVVQRLVAIRELVLVSVAFGPDGTMSERLREAGVGTRLIPWRGLRDWQATTELGRRILGRADRPDVLHSFCRWPDLASRAFQAGLEHVPLSTSAGSLPGHGTGGLLHRLADAAADRATRQRCRAVAAASPLIRDGFLARGLPPGMVRVIPPGIDAVQIFPLSANGRQRHRSLMGVDHETPMVVFSSREHPARDQDALLTIRACAALIPALPRLRLFVLGEGYGPAVDHAVAAAPFSRRIGTLSEMTGRVYSSSDVVVRGTSPGSFPSGALEAQASGTPVIALVDRGNTAYREGAPAHLAQQGIPSLSAVGENDALARAVVLARESGADPLSRAIKGLLDSAEPRQEFGAAARDYVLDHFELSHTVDAYVALWRELAPEASWRMTDSIPLVDLEELQRDSDSGNNINPRPSPRRQG